MKMRPNEQTGIMQEAVTKLSDMVKQLPESLEKQGPAAAACLLWSAHQAACFSEKGKAGDELDFCNPEFVWVMTKFFARFCELTGRPFTEDMSELLRFSARRDRWVLTDVLAWENIVKFLIEYYESPAIEAWSSVSWFLFAFTQEGHISEEYGRALKGMLSEELQANSQLTPDQVVAYADKMYGQQGGKQQPGN